MAMRLTARSMAARVFAAGWRSPSLSGTGSGASSRRFFCTKEQLKNHPKHAKLPPRRESIWAEMKEWKPEEKFFAAFGTAVFPFGIWAGIEFALCMEEIWRTGGLQSSDPSWDEDD